ncbi:MAG: DUF421 domain-containing protein [Firmicutes bacterium HGW-Firmicutes-14]|nr:MAG: DUF421 domain-containing protein [Firmicutes bacterium HGW-Firmicutes-14]
MPEGLQIVFRSAAAFFTLLIFTRILGKQQVSQLTFFDYIIGITVGSIAADIIDSNRDLVWQMIGLTSWMALAFVLQVVTLKSRKLSKIIDGDPVVVVKNGKILEQNMAKMRYKTKELLEQLRTKGAFDLGNVEFAILESNGELSVLQKSQHLPVTPNDMNIPTKYKGLSTSLILEGTIIRENLDKCGLTVDWLLGEIKKQGIKSPKEIIIASLDTEGKLYIDKYNDDVGNK